MKLQFDSSRIPYLQTLVREVRDSEQTQEIRLPEDFPDAAEILAVWGQPLLCSKEWLGDSMRISGGVKIYVLYRPESEDPVQSVEGWVPVSEKWNFPETSQEGTIRVRCNLKNADARMVTPRKFLLRAQTWTWGEALAGADAEVFCPEENPEQTQLLRCCYPVQLPAEAGEKLFPVEDALHVPASCPPVQRLLRADLQADLADWKILSGKLVFRGTARLHILYSSQDGQVQCWDFELPFSQFSDLEQDFGEDAQAEITIQITGLELELEDDGTIRLKSALVAQYLVSCRRELRVVEDGYCRNRTLTLDMKELELPEILESVSCPVTARKEIPASGKRIVDIGFLPGGIQEISAGDTVRTEFTGKFQILYDQGDGSLAGAQADWNASGEVPLDSHASLYLDAAPSGRPQISFSGGLLEMKNELTVQRRTQCSGGRSMAAGMELGEPEPSGERPSLILRRAGNESLWEIAKAAGSTVEAIRSANHLQQDPGPGQLLLIPIR